MKIAVLVAVFNRVDTTLEGLASLYAEIAKQTEASFEVFLLDDASPDGTADRVREHFGEVHVLDGTGNLWWVRGMDVAYKAALRHPSAFDAYLLYNDDVRLKAGALQEVVRTFVELNNEAPTALFGSMCTADGQPSYPGRSVDSRHHPFRPFSPRLLKPTLPNGQVQPCDTFHANCLVIPAGIMEELGGMDPWFLHRHGDTDLGFRLARRGVRNMIMPDYVGLCELNPPSPLAPTFWSRVRQQLNPPNSIFDEMKMALRYYPLPTALVNIAVRFAYLFRNAWRPRQQPMTAEAWRANKRKTGQ